MIKGVNVGNFQWKQWPWSNQVWLEAHRPEGLLVYDWPEEALFETHKGDVEWYQQENRGVRVVWRLMDYGVMRRNPTTKAREHARRMDRWGPEGRDVIPANEDNLESGFDGGSVSEWEIMCVWLSLWAKEYRKFRPQDRLHIPAISPSTHEYAKSWDVVVEQHVAELFDVVDLHVYDPAHFADVDNVARFGLPIWVTETNQVPLDLVCTTLKDKVEGVLFFILDSDDEAFDFCNLIKKPELWR